MLKMNLLFYNYHLYSPHNSIFISTALDMVPPAAVRKHFLTQLEIHDEDPNAALEKLKTHSFDEMVPIMQGMLKVQSTPAYPDTEGTSSNSPDNANSGYTNEKDLNLVLLREEIIIAACSFDLSFF